MYERHQTRTGNGARALVGVAVIALASLAAPPGVQADIGIAFMNGGSLYDTGDFKQTANDLELTNPAIAYDGDFLLTFGDRRGSALVGFGYFWARRTQADDIPFESNDPKRLQMLGFPFTAGYMKRWERANGHYWSLGAMAQYFFMKTTAENPDAVDPSWFILREGDTGDRDAQGPGIAVTAGYEMPFFLGLWGAGIKARWTALSVDDVRGLATPDFQISGVSVFVSVALDEESSVPDEEREE
ncbi:MAG: hypothetical protein HKN20_16445 [Gemmatimonadetes bacterium]|nr:hypothetical protein [Gemmatimonadota bacterium]